MREKGRRVYLAGLSGAGKTSVAERIAAWLGWPAYDVDREIERRTGRTVAELWADGGEEVFRREEHAAVEELTALGDSGVVALGGGTLEDPASRERLAAWGTGVFLDAPAETLAARVAGNGGLRPLLAGHAPVEVLRGLAVARGPGFAALPHRVDADRQPVEAVATQVLRALDWPPPEPITAGIWVGRGALAHAGNLLSDACQTERRSVVVVTDDDVWRLHGAALETGLAGAGWEAIPCLLPPGEEAKTPDCLARLWRAFAAAGTDRDTPAVILGGGAVGDAGGLAAATFKRGLPLVLFPTTLLAQVDAAIGGKNAVNFAGVKNLIGTFHFPAAVAGDPLCLLTLPERDWRSGWAEVVKAAVIGDPDLLELCERESEALLARRLDVVEEALRRSIAVKVAVVAADPREGGRRGVLNLGHTLGHALEAAGAGRWTHGEAVAIGIVAAARLAEAEGVAPKGLAERLASILDAFGLPTRGRREVAAASLHAAIRLDKKRRSGVLRLALPAAVGEVVLREVGEAAVAAWLERTCAWEEPR